MKKALIGLIVMFLSVGVFAGVYAIRNSNSLDTKDSYSEDVWYPDHLRGNANKNTTEEAPEKTEGNMEIEELVPDENYEEFDIEEESAPEDAAPETAPETAPEAAPEAAPAPESTSESGQETSVLVEGKGPGSEIIITSYRVNVRTNPNESAIILAIAREGDTGSFVRQEAEWSVLKVRGVEGFVHNSCWRFT